LPALEGLKWKPDRSMNQRSAELSTVARLQRRPRLRYSFLEYSEPGRRLAAMERLHGPALPVQQNCRFPSQNSLKRKPPRPPGNRSSEPSPAAHFQRLSALRESSEENLEFLHRLAAIEPLFEPESPMRRRCRFPSRDGLNGKTHSPLERRSAPPRSPPACQIEGTLRRAFGELFAFWHRLPAIEQCFGPESQFLRCSSSP
jgi:hypothetical protein